ncbi:DUF3164 family protein [Ignatzschineria cameli]|uniref:Sulfate transporter n=1 Tax=Ignatzschineria cameli TaxID=2182793 RepID=A0ABX5L488_9GAMM|nr:DUF3164 family protein [Ignatzschineria cameli]PWD90372.1 sulfate transporter [Ignatzschineria cameli]PWD92255.1 sulfate transporter [Ignatzschineria cameli]PWD93049.1 sulfate transporter [Ignatzschineria cameli]
MINPDKYRENAHGNLVNIANIKESDLLRDEVVKEIILEVIGLRSKLSAAKEEFFSSFHSFVELSAEKYGVKLGGKKGNTTLYSFDGKYRIDFAINERIELDERVNAAKALIDECIKDWSAGSNANVITLINQAFKVDKWGNLNTRRILELRNVEIDDERWNNAMDAISDSLQVIDSKQYMRFYERLENGEYQQISLDFAAI